MRAALLLGLFLCGFLLTAWGIRSCLPEPLSNGRRLKFEHLRDAGDDYSLIVIGSSRVNHTIVPSVLEERLTAHGVPQRVYNYGIAAMHSFEADRVLDQVLALDLPKLRVVVMEWPDWDAVTIGKQPLSERGLQWHSFGRTRTAIESLLTSGHPRGVVAREAALHLKVGFARVANYGVGSTWLQRELGFNQFDDLPESVLRDGFAATGDVDVRTPEEVAKRVRKTELMLARKHVLDLGNHMQVDGQNYLRSALKEQSERARAHGVRLIWAVMPGDKHHPQAWRLKDEEPDLPLLLFNSPELYPDAYTLAHRWDPDHLNDEGAHAFSAVFADVLAEELQRP